MRKYQRPNSVSMKNKMGNVEYVIHIIGSGIYVWKRQGHEYRKDGGKECLVIKKIPWYGPQFLL